MKIGIWIFLLLAPGLVWSGGVVPKEEKVLVVYYSRDGHTKLVAEQIAKKFDADLEQLIDKKKRTGPAGTSAAGKDAITGNLTALQPLKHNPRDYGIVFIGTPSWFGNVTPAVRTFIKNNDLSGKKIGIFGTAHLTGVENALKQTAGLITKENAERMPKLALRHRDLPETILAEKIDVFYRECLDVFALAQSENITK